MTRVDHAMLTRTERTTLWWLRLGQDPKQIALTLQRSPRTVRNHIAAIHTKVGAARTRPDCVDWALTHSDCCARPWELQVGVTSSCHEA